MTIVSVYSLPSTAFSTRQSVKKVSVDVNYRAELELAKVQVPPSRPCSPFENVAEKKFTVEVDRAPEKALVLDPSITKLSAGKTQHEYLTDQPVFSQGDPALAVFYIQSGKVRLTVQSIDGEQAVISILAEGSFLGEGCLAGQSERRSTASALLRSMIVRIEKKAMMDLLRTDPEFAERFLTYTLTRGICIEEDLGSRVFDSREKRRTRMRGKKAGVGTGWKPIPVAAMMSSESMAGVIGTTSSNVSSILESFRERGFIDSKGAGMLVHHSLMSLVPHGDGIC
jgi:CRP-like cAMP-binding protein